MVRHVANVRVNHRITDHLDVSQSRAVVRGARTESNRLLVQASDQDAQCTHIALPESELRIVGLVRKSKKDPRIHALTVDSNSRDRPIPREDLSHIEWTKSKVQRPLLKIFHLNMERFFPRERLLPRCVGKIVLRLRDVQ